MIKNKETISKLKKFLRLTLELAEPNHKCENCPLSEKCRNAYRKIIKSEMDNMDFIDDFDDEFCYPLVDGDEKDCLIRSEVRKLLNDGDKKVVAKN